MKKDLNRALNAFAAMEALPDSLVLDAEKALLEAEAGIAVAKPRSGFKRFLNSGWGAAVISGIVAIGVLIFIVRAGREAPVYEPPVKHAGSTIEMSAEGADFTLSMEQGSYDEGANRITVVMTGKTKGESISMLNAWHLERLTAEGAEVVGITYTEEVIESAKPGWGEYATIQKSINVEEPLMVGHYRLHATKHDGEKYVSVAYCTFTVGDPGDLTWGEDTEPIEEYPSADQRSYTVTTSETLEFGASGLGITVKAVEQGATLFPHRNYRIVKLAGTPNSKDASWLQSAEAVEARPSEENGGYAVFTDSVTFETPAEWLPGLYRLYALNHDGEYIDYCDFVIKGDHGMNHEMFLTKTVYTTTDTDLDMQILGHQKGASVSWHEGWSLYALNGDQRELLGSCRPIDIAYETPEPAPDEFVLVDIGKSIRNVTGGKYTSLPAGEYELVYGSGDSRHRMPFTVVEDPNPPLTTDDPDKTVARGTFFWANGHPFINLSWGEVYPVSFTVENDAIDFSGLTSGDTVEIIMDAWIGETFPCQGTMYELRKVSDGSMEDLPDALIKAMGELDYTVTETEE